MSNIFCVTKVNPDNTQQVICTFTGPSLASILKIDENNKMLYLINYPYKNEIIKISLDDVNNTTKLMFAEMKHFKLLSSVFNNDSSKLFVPSSDHILTMFDMTSDKLDSVIIFDGKNQGVAFNDDNFIQFSGIKVDKEKNVLYYVLMTQIELKIISIDPDSGNLLSLNKISINDNKLRNVISFNCEIEIFESKLLIFFIKDEKHFLIVIDCDDFSKRKICDLPINFCYRSPFVIFKMEDVIISTNNDNICLPYQCVVLTEKTNIEDSHEKKIKEALQKLPNRKKNIIDFKCETLSQISNPILTERDAMNNTTFECEHTCGNIFEPIKFKTQFSFNIGDHEVYQNPENIKFFINYSQIINDEMILM